MKRTLLVIILFSFWMPVSLSGETENKIKEATNSMLETHTYRLSIFRIQPKFSMDSGYNSNSFGSAGEELGDYYFSVVPGGSFALKLGRRGYVALDEDLNFLYYRDLQQLRDIFNTSSLHLVTGSRRLLIDLAGSYVSKKAPIDNEFDIPVQQELLGGGAELTYSLNRKVDLNVQFGSTKAQYRQAADVDSAFNPPSDYLTLSYGGGVEYKFRPNLRFSMEGSLGTTEFLSQTQDPNLNDTSNSWQALGGLVFTGRRMVGGARVGFGQTESTQRDQGRFNDLIVDTDLNMIFRKRLTFGILLKRQRSVSALLQNNFRLSTEVGVRSSLPIIRRIFVDGTFKIGKNDYGEQNFDDEQPITKDDFQQADLGLNFVLTKNLVLRGGATYLNRDSNLDELTKDRFTYSIGIAFEPRFISRKTP